MDKSDQIFKDKKKRESYKEGERIIGYAKNKYSRKGVGK